MKLFSSIIILAFLVPDQCIAQKPPFPEFGIYNTTEKTMKECSFDQGADAVIILDEAFSDYDDEYHLITNRRVRMKILKQSGVDKATIIIPFYSKDKFEYIYNIEGITYDPETGDQTPLNKKSIYNENVNSLYSNMRFALPNVKVGSIIEYKYTSVMKHYGGLQDWAFQSELPTVRSAFMLRILPQAEFNYLVTKKANYPIVIDPRKDEGKIYFEMNNIPGLRSEPYMDAPKDYIQRVEFQLAGYRNSFGSKQSVYQTWKAIALDLATDKDLGNSTKKKFIDTRRIKITGGCSKNANG